MRFSLSRTLTTDVKELDYFSNGAFWRIPHLQRRHADIETLRGVTCLLLVAFHVVGGNSGSGIAVSDGSSWRIIADLLAYIRMPLFACISGYCFHAVVKSWNDVENSIKRKLRRLGIPLVVVSFLFYLTSCSIGGNFCATAPWQILVLPYAHFWFLQSIILVMCLVAVCTFLAGSNSKLLTAIALPISALLAMSGFGFSVNYFSVNGAIYLLPFFLLGHTLQAWSAIPSNSNSPTLRRVVLTVLGATLLFLWIMLGKSVYDHGGSFGAVGHVFGLGLSALSCVFLFLLRPHIPSLALIGSFSYAIYLFHPFFTSASRRSVLALDPSIPKEFLFAIGLIAGILFPIAIHLVAVRYRLIALLLLGIDTSKNTPEPLIRASEPEPIGNRMG